jgi:hypothetical protein
MYQGGDSRRGNGWVEARHMARRWMRAGKYALGHDPLFLPILLRLTPLGTSRQITDGTELVIEGFPRSGNTYTVFALQDAAQHQLKLSSHVHHPSQVKLAVERGVPTILVVREPIAALSSYLTYGQHARPTHVLREYYSYHQELIPYADRVLVLTFEEIVSDMSAIIERINCRFAMVLPPFDQSAENVNHLFEEIARQHQLVHPDLQPDHVAPRPTIARRQINEHHRDELLDPRHEALRSQCANIYEYYCQKASEQGQLFRKIPSARAIPVKKRPRPLPSVSAAEELFRSNG